ncbi:MULTISPECIES: hypothetical protein [unclassified Mesorhizobium]|nr:MULTISPECIES: hypothetical protein [unclassified Mesorhizobium]
MDAPVDGNEEAQLAFGDLHLGDVDMEMADRIWVVPSGPDRKS